MNTEQLSLSAARAMAALAVGLLGLGTDHVRADADAEMQQLKAAIASVDESIGQLRPRIEKCARLGYYRQKRWWELRLRVESEGREKLEVRKKSL